LQTLLSLQSAFVVQQVSEFGMQALRGVHQKVPCGQRHIPSAGVHTCPSGQVIAVPEQVPLAHTSPVVQAKVSSQVFVLFAWAQPVWALQLSVVQTLLSLQSSAVPDRQRLPATSQVSVPLQTLLSLQSALVVQQVSL